MQFTRRNIIHGVQCISTEEYINICKRVGVVFIIKFDLFTFGYELQE